MIVAVMSDSHDNIWNLRKGLEVIKNENAGMIVHCGDFVAPFMLEELNIAGIPVHGVFGNNDGDQYLLTKFSHTTLSHVTLHGLWGQVDIDGFGLAFTHQEVVAKGLASTDDFEMVCFGHSHAYGHQQVGRTTLLNPGEIMGKDGLAGFCLIDTITSKIQRVEIT